VKPRARSPARLEEHSASAVRACPEKTIRWGNHTFQTDAWQFIWRNEQSQPSDAVDLKSVKMTFGEPEIALVNAAHAPLNEKHKRDFRNLANEGKQTRIRGGYMELKERAIYQLPNGRELVARVNKPDKLVLQNLSATHPGEYELNEEGRLSCDWKLTGWGVHDLVETGRTAPPDLTGALDDSLRTQQAASDQKVNV
jgi:hypothetical protein